MTSRSPLPAWPKVLAGATLTGFCALSVHVVMLEWLHVPYPYGYPEDGLPPFLPEAALALAVVCFWRLASDRLAILPRAAQCAILFLLLAMLREQLVRKPTMEGVVTTAWIHSFVANIPMLVPFLVLACLVVPFTPRLATAWQRIGGALAAALLAFAVAGPLFARAFQPLLASIAFLEHGEVCTHGPCVEIPAYLTYIEPVTAAFVVVALVWDRLSPRPPLRLAQFVLLLMVMDLSFFRPPVYGLYDPAGFGAGMLSMGQFWLEHLVLALGTAATWVLSGIADAATAPAEADRDRPGRPQTQDGWSGDRVPAPGMEDGCGGELRPGPGATRDGRPQAAADLAGGCAPSRVGEES